MIKRIHQLKQGDNIYCSVCGKPFTLGPQHKYIINGGYSCSWECFLKASRPKEEVKQVVPVISNEGLLETVTSEPIKEEEKPVVKKRGRKKKEDK